MSTYNVPENNRSDSGSGGRANSFAARPWGSRADMVRTWEAYLSEARIRTPRFASATLSVLLGQNAQVGQTAGDYLAVPAELCVRACAAGLFSAGSCNVVTAVVLPSRTLRCLPVPRLLVMAPGIDRAARSIGLPSQTTSPSRHRIHDAARNIDHDRRLAKPVIVLTIASMSARSPLLSSAAPAPASALRAGFFNVKDAAEYLGLSPHTLYVWRHRRQGPPSFRMGPRGRVMYRREAVDAWIREQEQADSRANASLSPLIANSQQRASRLPNA
ncbi:helix-turn-helix transcriptional regulator [Streptomyces sp. NPDC006978]|uniref:helix-turn-helix transcriptional regulator n=1 Tax=Streptomyces sp. NPDC006978 TaxID=3364769 RepID=UPI0036755194